MSAQVSDLARSLNAKHANTLHPLHLSHPRPTTGETFKIPHTDMPLSLHNLITCTKCQKQYVGETSTPLQTRFTNHRSDIRRDNDTSIVRHFNTLGHSTDHLLILAIDRPSSSDFIGITRRNRETHWTYSPDHRTQCY